MNKRTVAGRPSASFGQIPRTRNDPRATMTDTDNDKKVKPIGELFNFMRPPLPPLKNYGKLGYHGGYTNRSIKFEKACLEQSIWERSQGKWHYEYDHNGLLVATYQTPEESVLSLR